MLLSRSFWLFFPCLHYPPSNSQQMSVVDRHSAVSETELMHHRGMSPLSHQAQGWSKVRQGCIWLFWQWPAAGRSVSATERGGRGWLLLHAPWGMKGCGRRGSLFFQMQTQPSLPQPWPWLTGATWPCSLGKEVMGHSAGLPTSSPRQLLCLPVLCLLWKKTPGTKASIQTQADTAHLGLAGSSPSGFKASERMGLAKGHFTACISLEKLCLLCYQSWEKGLWEKKGRTTRIWLWSWEKRESILFVWVCFFLKHKRQRKQWTLLYSRGVQTWTPIHVHEVSFQLFTSGASLT